MFPQTAPRYPEDLVQPMRRELTSIGVKELKTPDEVEQAISGQPGTTLLIINSVCGCAAGNARPAVRMALDHDTIPDHVTTVFAGVDIEAVSTARSYIAGYPPSSPSMALFKDGQLVYMMPRHHIEGRMPQQIADDLRRVFEDHCHS